jgi:hypothetical protein
MARITWEFQQDVGHWLGKVGARVAFVVKPSPDNQAWDLLFNWTGVTYEGFPNIASTRDPAERKLIIFAEQTGITLPENVEEENTLAQELIERLQSEVRWFKDGETDEQRAGYVATQALYVFDELIEAQRAAVDQNNTALGSKAFAELDALSKLLSLVRDAQKELGVEVEREVQ